MSSRTFFGSKRKSKIDLDGKLLCEICEHLFATAETLHRHQSRFHDPQHSCLLCKKQLAKGKRIHHHMAEVHKKAQVYSCGCCNSTFSDIHDLIDHLILMVETSTTGDVEPIAIAGDIPEVYRDIILPYPVKSEMPSTSGTSSAPPPRLIKTASRKMKEEVKTEIVSPVKKEIEEEEPKNEMDERKKRFFETYKGFFPDKTKVTAPSKKDDSNLVQDHIADENSESSSNVASTSSSASFSAPPAKRARLEEDPNTDI